MFKKKTDGRFRVEMKFKNGHDSFLVSDDYKKICGYYELVKTPFDDKFHEIILEAVLYDGDKPLASWTNSAALCKAA